ncbi:hypothetical protein [Novosphingobium album (ex Liu et al. 2023)]|uniref:SGNH/GDSL hydrolase family protein n=1 Tax=Novosphingobium album (ex Liu et al. 2023) TaxID=3031130 RepID=A0ABT5WS14_9SPHN|nr:hypothetical protein [Novosphingobium album (ex Liu et al. 2023)]MDE8652837.1 hypothetical protein [Novosphingobium album (ex Liu et al. 2023)]
MFECLIFGDSIGLGTARAVNERYPSQCEVRAAERATAHQMVSWIIPPRIFGTSVLAIGSNDAPTPGLSVKLTRIRARIPSRRVIWLLPYDRQRAALVSLVAARYNDETLDLDRFPTRDRIHPASYRQVANVLLKPRP